jgi:hypothetical protein
MRETLLFKFTITYLFTVGLFGTFMYFNLLDMTYEDVFFFSLITSVFYTVLSIDKKIKNTDELIKNNYWQLKNELKRKVNGREKKNGGKQVL